ncbi:MAG TPA: hypothetical protein VG621_01920 [Candidatus Paceibacterota bacterium]|nr:hypothetical protein [Candidatus Paceibacterota bacterium]
MRTYLITTLIIMCGLSGFSVAFAQQYVPSIPTTSNTPALTGTTTLTGTPVTPTPPNPSDYTVCANGSIVGPNQNCPNTAATNQVLSRFNPGITTTTNGNNTFGGLTFSGVGGAVLSCANIGQSIVSGVSDLFKSAEQQKSSAFSNTLGQAATTVVGTTEEQPVTDKKALAELQKETQRENCLNGIAYQVAKNALQQISTQTLNWVTTGLNGNPFYVRDINSYLTNIQNQQIAQFLGTVGTSDPIFGNALRSTITQLVTGYDDGRINVAMNTPQAIAYQNFQNDFTQGGWPAFLDPANNPLGALFKATDSLGNTVGTAQQNVKDQLQAGNGFLDMQKCVEYAPASSNSSSTSAINPLGAYASLCATITPANQAYCKTHSGEVAAGAQQQQCIKYETVTPGSIIAAQTAAITTSPIRQAEEADKINEVLGSFFDGLVNRLFSTGLASLAGTLTSGTTGTNTVLDANGNPISNDTTSVQDAFGYQPANGGFYGEFDISRPQQLRAVLKTQMNFLNRVEDTQVAMSTVVPTLGELDYCFPGPNPTWQVGTDYNFQLFDAALQGKQPNKTLGNVVSELSTAGLAVPGYGAVIAAVGNVVGQIINIAGGDTPKSLTTHNLQLFDKVTNGARQVGDYNIERSDNIDLLSFLERNYNTVMQQYQTKFDPTTLTDAFIATDPADAADIRGKVADIIDETGNLVYDNQLISQYSQQQTQYISDTEDAIQQLSAINDQVEGIVAQAKARYIKQMSDAGTPVNVDRVIDPTTGKPGELCIDQAYDVNTDQIKADPRVTTDTDSATAQLVQQSKDAAAYFYSHL